VVSVVVPTRNERDNVVELVGRLHAAMAGAAFEVIFVDDSTDDTPDVVAGLSKDYSGTTTRVSLIHRPPQERGDGLSGAVVRGLRSAQAELVAVMDSDLQHPPEVLVALLEAAAGGEVDLVVGSRYVDTGEAGGLDGVVRKLTSRAAGTAARMLFPRRLASITDPMSGLFLVRRDALTPEALRPLGFKILLEIAVRSGQLRVAEVPFVFAERHAGESKAGLQEGLRFLRHLVRLRLSGSFGRMLGVALIGVTGLVVNTVALWTLHGVLGLGLTAAAVLSTQVSTAWNAVLSLVLVYRGRHGGAWWSALVTLGVVNNAALIFRVPLLHLLVGPAGLDYLWANVLTLLLAFGLRFMIVDRSMTRRATT
jgi:putative flippase GtrA